MLEMNDMLSQVEELLHIFYLTGSQRHRNSRNKTNFIIIHLINTYCSVNRTHWILISSIRLKMNENLV